MKSLFVIKVDHITDLITNSSSELFVLKGQSKKIVEKMIASIYPNYLDEYRELKSTAELSDNEINTYIIYNYDTWDAKPGKCKLLPGFSFDEMYQKESPWGGDHRTDRYWIRNDFVKQNRARINEAIDINNQMYFLFSEDENPNWDMQEALWEIGERHHLG